MSKMSTFSYLGSILEGINSGIGNAMKIEENRRMNEVLVMKKKQERDAEEEKRKEAERKENIAKALSKALDYYQSPENEREASLFTDEDMSKARQQTSDAGEQITEIMSKWPNNAKPVQQEKGKSKQLKMFVNKINEFMPEDQKLSLAETMEAMSISNNLAKLNFEDARRKTEETQQAVEDKQQGILFGQQQKIGKQNIELKQLEIEERKKPKQVQPDKEEGGGGKPVDLPRILEQVQNLFQTKFQKIKGINTPENDDAVKKAMDLFNNKISNKKNLTQDDINSAVQEAYSAVSGHDSISGKIKVDDWIERNKEALLR